MTLTDRQKKILDVIQGHLDRHGYPPTIREIGRAVGISSTSVVNYHLNKLKKWGLIERDGQVSRGLKLPAYGNPHLLAIPILGTIQAGQPVPVMEPKALGEADETDVIELTRDIASDRDNVFALRVKGDSMIDALINEGDIVVMQHVETASNGDMVAAWIKDREETTLKHFYRENGQVRLQPANPTMDPIYVAADNVEIQGKVIAVIRNLG
ncbi:repressor LexA [bacterium]|nr:MAG: repressor LexA [bacterium]